MPELPEVETIRTQLSPLLPFTIESANFSSLSQRLIKQMDFDLTGFRITHIERQAKWLIFNLHPHGHILSHLGMSGSWRISDHPLQNKHGHIEWIDHSKTSPQVLTYVDPRRFGHLYVLNPFNFQTKMATFPIDITSPDFDLDHIAEILFRFPYKVLKSLLLDQRFFPGVGNYMASEVCARAGLLPTRLVGELEAAEIIKIKEALQTTIQGAIATKGTTFGGGYRDANGAKGEGANRLVVFYQKYCQMCLAQKRMTPVIKTTLAGRGTYHCPHCQR